MIDIVNEIHINDYVPEIIITTYDENGEQISPSPFDGCEFCFLSRMKLRGQQAK